jgi:hypothetical protein
MQTGAVEAQPGRAARETALARGGAQTIVVHADRELGPPSLRQGFLHGITYARGKDYSRAVALISDLKLRSWRLSHHHNDVYAFVVGEAKLPRNQGTEIVFNIQDVFNIRNGYDVKVAPTCRPNAKSCFSSYDGFKRSWMNVVNAVMKAQTERRLTIDYFDVFAEPTNGGGKLGLTPQQFGDIFRSTHDAIRQFRRDAKIVAPSIVSYQERFLKAFLRFVADHNLRLDAISWHEFHAPESLPEHTREIREFFRSKPALCNPVCPEIHINEYASDAQHLVPGFSVGWLYYLEQARVDHANRGCWDVAKGGSTCWTGFNGMLMPDNATPNVLYWVYKAYAELNRTRIASESSTSRTIALASKDAGRKEIRLLAGRFGQKGPGGHVTIEVRDFRFDSSARAEIIRIPSAGNAMRAAPAQPAPKSQVIAAPGGIVTIVLDDFQDGDAYSIVLRPASGGAR